MPLVRGSIDIVLATRRRSPVAGFSTRTVELHIVALIMTYCAVASLSAKTANMDMEFEAGKTARQLGKRVRNRVRLRDGGFERTKAVCLQRMLAQPTQVTPQLRFDDTSLGSRIVCGC